MKALTFSTILLISISLCRGETEPTHIYGLNPYTYEERGEDLILHCNVRVDGEIYGIIRVRFEKDSVWRKEIEAKIKGASLMRSYFRLTTSEPANKMAVFSAPRIDRVTPETTDELNRIANKIEQRNQEREVSEIVDFMEISLNEYQAIKPKNIHVEEQDE